VSAVGHFQNGGVWLTVNGATKQKSDVSHLIWSVAETVADLSKFFRLEAGDVIYTGTPEGVGAVSRGDLMSVGVERLGELSVRVI
jgi:fumarylpyruvate hydrolase